MEGLFALTEFESSMMAKASKVQRRSACDDCRARKVQCSGDIAGCQRCRRANIRCTYSAPKPPGRPRKVRKIAEENGHGDAHPPPPAPQSAAGGFYFGDLFGGDLMGQSLERFVFSGGNGDGLGGNSGVPYVPNSSDLFGEVPLEANPYGFSAPFDTAPISVPQLPATPKSISSSSPPHPVPWGTSRSSDDAHSSSGCTTLTTVQQPCSCLPTFFTAISTLRTPPSPRGFSLPPTLSTIRTTLTVITTSMHCRYCHSSVQSTYVCMMMLGTLIPLLLLYIENAQTAISSCDDASVTLNLGGVDVELDKNAWRDMATGAVRKEFESLMRMVDAIEGILQKRHCQGRGKEKEGLEAIARSGGGDDVGEVVGRELTNKQHETGEPPFCLGLLWMIRGMATRVGAGYPAPFPTS